MPQNRREHASTNHAPAETAGGRRFSTDDFEPKDASRHTGLLSAVISAAVFGLVFTYWIKVHPDSDAPARPPARAMAALQAPGGDLRPVPPAALPDAAPPSSPPSRLASATAVAAPAAADAAAFAAPVVAATTREPVEHPRPVAKAATPGPSADCAAGGGQAERMVCGDVELAAADRRLTQAYARASAAGAPPAALQARREKWAAAREAAAAQSPRALAGAYEQQIYELNAQAN